MLGKNIYVVDMKTSKEISRNKFKSRCDGFTVMTHKLKCSLLVTVKVTKFPKKRLKLKFRITKSAHIHLQTKNVLLLLIIIFSFNFSSLIISNLYYWQFVSFPSSESFIFSTQSSKMSRKRPQDFSGMVIAVRKLVFTFNKLTYFVYN